MFFGVYGMDIFYVIDLNVCDEMKCDYKKIVFNMYIV